MELDQEADASGAQATQQQEPPGTARLDVKVEIGTPLHTGGQDQEQTQAGQGSHRTNPIESTQPNQTVIVPKIEAAEEREAAKGATFLGTTKEEATEVQREGVRPTGEQADPATEVAESGPGSAD